MSSRFALFMSLVLAAAGASAQTAAPAVEVVADVPAKLNPGAKESLALIVPAKGVQIYECRAKYGQADQYEWAFVAPEAELFDARGAKVGTHYAGPHWESADGSKVVGKVIARADAPRSDAIPWLLLATKSAGAAGAFSKVTSIQRVNTVGGVAPKDGCSQRTVGAIGRVDYTADYYFYQGR
jgi:hypothetical protein